MKYFLFSGYNYYPRGGVRDLQGSYTELYLAKTGVPRQHEWAHITDENLNVLYTWRISDATFDPGEWFEVDNNNQKIQDVESVPH